MEIVTKRKFRKLKNQVFFKKKKVPISQSSSDLSIFLPKFSDLPIVCPITIIFFKSSAALLEFSKFRGTNHKMPICFAIPKFF